mmetsp:Transcript_22195/g.36740  ORF Transcript_22195/g.36740 Transcript_22195/m.36740 type:complete len:222 (-) Transcript_22195:942-1607(-)
MVRVIEVRSIRLDAHGRDGDNHGNESEEESHHVGEDMDVNPRAWDKGSEPCNRDCEGGSNRPSQGGNGTVSSKCAHVRLAGASLASGQVNTEASTVRMVTKHVVLPSSVDECVETSRSYRMGVTTNVQRVLEFERCDAPVLLDSCAFQTGSVFDGLNASFRFVAKKVLCGCSLLRLSDDRLRPRHLPVARHTKSKPGFTLIPQRSLENVTFNRPVKSHSRV